MPADDDDCKDPKDWGPGAELVAGLQQLRLADDASTGAATTSAAAAGIVSEDGDEDDSDDDIVIPDLAGGDAFAARRRDAGVSAASNKEQSQKQQQQPQQQQVTKEAEVGRFSRFSVGWDDVAAPEALKRRLQLIADQWSATLRLLRGDPKAAGGAEMAVSGVLLHGPSGCGKSLMARALVAAVGLPCLELSATDIRSRWLGDSERLLRRAFRECQANAPCVLLLDDVEHMAGQRSAISDQSDARGLEYRILSTLLNCLDGIDGGTLAKPASAEDQDGLPDVFPGLGEQDELAQQDNERGDGMGRRGGQSLAGARNIFVVACSRNLEAVDQALVRPGRLEVVLELSQPESAEEIAALLRAHIHRFDVPVSPTLSLENLAARLAREQPELGRTAAEICDVIREASLNALRRDIEAREILPEDVVDALE